MTLNDVPPAETSWKPLATGSAAEQKDRNEGGQCHKVKVKVGVLRPVQQPGSYWDRSSELPLVGLEPTEVTAYD